MAEHPIRLIRTLEAATGAALLMALSRESCLALRQPR